MVLFLYVDPSETVRDVKNKVEALLGQVQAYPAHYLQLLLELNSAIQIQDDIAAYDLSSVQPVAGQRLLKGDAVLDSDGSKLADLNIDYDDELFLVYKLNGESNICSTLWHSATESSEATTFCTGDSWEDVDIATKSDVKQEQ